MMKTRIRLAIFIGLGYLLVQTGCSDTYPAIWDTNVDTLKGTHSALLEFAGTVNGGIARSTDSGTTWQPSPSSRPYIAVNFAWNSRYIFASVMGGALVLRSSDSGRTWRSVGAGINDTATTAILASENYLLAGGSMTGLYRSTNNGDSWTHLPVTMGSCYSIIRNDNYLFACGWGSGVFRSADSGLTWTAMNNGLSVANAGLLSFCLGAANSSLYEGAYNGAVLTSSDNGQSWRGLSHVSTAIYHLLANGTSLIAATASGLYYSADGGNTWYPYPSLPTLATTLAAAISGRVVMAGIGNSMFRSTDDGATWSRANKGLLDSVIYALGIR